MPATKKLSMVKDRAPPMTWPAAPVKGKTGHRAAAIVTHKAITAPMAGGMKTALHLTVEMAPLLAIVRRHVDLSASAARALRQELLELFELSNVTVASTRLPKKGTGSVAGRTTRAAVSNAAAGDDLVISTQDAADLVGVSRPYIVARIDAGDIPLYQQVGNQRRVLKSAVMAWHKREQTKRRRALNKLGAELDQEIFMG